MDTQATRSSRRTFVQMATAGLGLAAASTSRAAAAPSDRIRVGFIGLGDRAPAASTNSCGTPTWTRLQCAISTRPHLDSAAGLWRRSRAASRRQFHDFRKVLERKDLDAVMIATPDHWHALPVIHACQAGKDVFVEKPLSYSIGEGRAMVQGARKIQPHYPDGQPHPQRPA